MPKNSLNQIKQDEKKILDELSKNADKSVNEIAQSLGFSRQKVWRIVKNLEKNHTIWGYIAVLHEEKLNHKSYILIVKRTNKPSDKKVIDKIVNRELANEVSLIGVKIINSSFTNGFYDWVIYFNAPDIRIAKIFVEKFNIIYGELVSETHLLENIFPLVNSGITNPEIKKLKDFLKT